MKKPLRGEELGKLYFQKNERTASRRLCQDGREAVSKAPPVAEAEGCAGWQLFGCCLCVLNWQGAYTMGIWQYARHFIYIPGRIVAMLWVCLLGQVRLGCILCL